MNEQLIIRLGEQPTSPVYWLVRDSASGELISSGALPTAAELATLSERAGGRKLVVLVPGTQVTVHEVELPPGNPRVALRALPYQLEEALAEDVEQFQLVPLVRTGQLQPVMVVRHSQLRSWLGWLAEGGLQADWILPDTLALPAGAAVAFDDLWLIRPETGPALAIEESLLPALVPALVEAQGECRWQLWQEWPLTEVEGLTLEAQPEELPLWVLACNLPSRQVNLLAGGYAPKREWRGPVVAYLPVAASVLLLFVLALLFKGLSWWRDGQTIAELRQHGQQVYQLAFPGDEPPRPEQLRTLMQNRVASIASDGGGGDFLAMLRAAAPAFKTVKGLELQSLRFDRRVGEIRVQAQGSNYADFEQVRAQLASQLAVEIGSQSSQGDKVIGAITIRRQP
ncbi:MAG: type II secretion system protein GspL [Corallincola sp.]|nr:type II secretion system protein GspL [Corallincola sp.]